MEISISFVSAKEVYPLRLLVLRPGGVISDCVFPNDNARDSYHLAGKYGGEILAVASFYKNGNEGVSSKNTVQLRGMATHPKVRGEGYGRKILLRAHDHFRKGGADTIWCNAREVAVPFYESLGYEKIGKPFEIEGIGKHWVMKSNLNP